MEDAEIAGTEVLGPAPLVRSNGGRQLSLQQEGLEVLRRARAPVHIVFAIGGSRCGKSTASNSLAFGADRGSDGFTTGDSFDPVTEGVDVATRQLPGGGSLIVADCEGAFHACGSAQSARGFGTLGLLAYRMSTAVLHVSMGSIDERDIEAIGFLAAHGGNLDSILGSEEPEGDEGALPKLPAMTGTPPSLFLLVNGARFNLGDAVAKKLLRVTEEGAESGRNCARQAITSAFHGPTALEGFPAIDHAAYWPKVNALRRRILECAPVSSETGEVAAGPQIVQQISSLVAALNGEAPSAVLAREPQAATEALYRSMHLDPLVEELSRRFAATGAATDAQPPVRVGPGEAPPASPTKRALSEMLAEFDRRTAWLAGKTATDGDTEEGARPLLPLEVLAEVRFRLAARLSGTREALARGRKQGAQSRPTRSRRPASLTGASPFGSEKENVTPGSPGTPSHKGFAALESMCAEVENQLEQYLSTCDVDLGELRAAIAATQEEVAQRMSRTVEADRQAAHGLKVLQENFQSQLRGLSEARLQCSNVQATDSSAAVAKLQSELLALGSGLPGATDKCSKQLSEVRDAIEAHRLQRQEAGNEASRAVESRLKALRSEISAETGNLGRLKDAFPQQFRKHVEDLQADLKCETQQRRQSQAALKEVVKRLQTSLEASAENLMEPSPARLLRTPTRSRNVSPRHATSVTQPGKEASRASRSALWGATSGATTPVSTSRSGTPTRLPAPPPASATGQNW